MFINIQDPSDTQKGDLRRAIRSQAALSSAACRKNTIAAKAASGSSSPESTDKSIKRRRRSKANIVKDEPSASATPQSLSPVESFHRIPSVPEWNLQSDPFRSLATSDSWHPLIPRLVHTYLTFIATEEQDPVYFSSRPALRREFWPEVMSHSALLHTNLLIATSHQSVSDIASPELVAWFRHRAIRSVQDSLDSVKDAATSEQAIAAVSLLCGWELEYGEDSSFYAHLQGLKVMVNMRGGFLHANFSPIIRQIILSVTHNLVLYTGSKPVFEETGINCREWSSHMSGIELPQGFAILKHSRLLFPATLDMVVELHAVLQRQRHRKFALLDIQSRLVEYDYTQYLPVDYCPLQCAADDAINNQAEKHIKVALLCIISRLQETSTKDYVALYATLSPHRLVNTVYADLGVWALFMICSILPSPPEYLLTGLRLLINNQCITEWFQARSLLEKYLYPVDDVDMDAGALWDRLAHGKGVEQVSTQFSRYNTGVFQPKKGSISATG